MLKIAYDPIYAHPLPEGHRFPMLKYELIPGQLLYEGVIGRDNLFSPGLLEENIITRTHDENYWHQLRDLTLSPKEQRRTGFPLSAQLAEREIRIAKGTIDGCRYAFDDGVAFNVAGGTHHAGSNWGEGFCLLNDQAIAANYLLDNKLATSILIIDLDVHQGNGTAEIFKNESRVFTFSMHGANNFPYRKEQSDLDIPLQDGVSDGEFLDILKTTLPRLIEQHKPDFIFYLSGVDILATDKLGKLALSKDACKARDQFVFEQCVKHNVPVQVSMGGGYSPQIKDIVEAHCNTFKAAIDLYF
ncbi:histone deacetylase [Mucilaginibacter gossypii]|uniref:histone deacetylase family protein n=1 Tax=Mucilaginibacter gossypii TaxID=551996 RepID=UPI000DCBC52D|nr:MULTISPECIES: histone deacetylase [Mucilaginibacter]QTE38691.1 histone deacetylase [Mucilaginibacter gossypii]RAV55237.1 histone deacetylase [Mucilaginibacter rubeus]